MTPRAKRASRATPKPAVYNDKVLGKRVNILFEVDGEKERFYPGTVKKVKMEQDEAGGSVVVEHFVQFDDGDSCWFVLTDEEKEGNLKWIKEPARKPAVVTPASKKQKLASASAKETSTPSSVLDSDDEEDEISVADPFPRSIKETILFMDELEPGKNYYQRQKDSSGECSATRVKLRKFAKKNPNHPGIKHYVQTNKWEPPNKESLFAFMELIKTII